MHSRGQHALRRAWRKTGADACFQLNRISFPGSGAVSSAPFVKPSQYNARFTSLFASSVMQDKYLPGDVEQSAQAHWQAIDAYKSSETAKDKGAQNRKKFCACSMLPYPSGKLHMGHVRNYTITDMMKQMQAMGLAFDWSREIVSCDPSFFIWYEWVFLKMLDIGIAYRMTL